MWLFLDCCLDFYVTFVWLLSDFLLTYNWLFYDLFLTTDWLLCHFYITFIWLFVDIFLTFTWLSSDFYQTFLWLFFSQKKSKKTAKSQVKVNWPLSDFYPTFLFYRASLVFNVIPSNNHHFSTHNLFAGSAPLQGQLRDTACTSHPIKFLPFSLFNHGSISFSSNPSCHSCSSFWPITFFHTICHQLCLGPEATNTPSRLCTIWRTHHKLVQWLASTVISVHCREYLWCDLLSLVLSVFQTQSCNTSPPQPLIPFNPKHCHPCSRNPCHPQW